MRYNSGITTSISDDGLCFFVDITLTETIVIEKPVAKELTRLVIESHPLCLSLPTNFTLYADLTAELPPLNFIDVIDFVQINDDSTARFQFETHVASPWTINSNISLYDPSGIVADVPSPYAIIETTPATCTAGTCFQEWELEITLASCEVSGSLTILMNA